MSTPDSRWMETVKEREVEDRTPEAPEAPEALEDRGPANVAFVEREMVDAAHRLMEAQRECQGSEAVGVS